MKSIPDLLWNEVEKIVSSKKNKIGRPEHDPRKTLEGIIYQLYTGVQWKMLPEKDGRLYAVLAAKKLNNAFDVAVDRCLKNIKYLPYIKKNMSQLDLVVHEYDAVEFEKLLVQAGFTKCSCNAEKIHYTFENKTKFMNWITAASPFYTVLGDLHASFIEDVTTTYIDLTHQKEGDSITYTDYLLYATAQK